MAEKNPHLGTRGRQAIPPPRPIPVGPFDPLPRELFEWRGPGLSPELRRNLWDFEADMAIRRNRQPGAELGRGSTRYRNAQNASYMKLPDSQRQPALPEQRFTLPGAKPGDPKVTQGEYHAWQKRHWVPAALQDINRPGSPTQKAINEASFDEALRRLQARASQLAQSVRQRGLTPEQASARLIQEGVKFENSLRRYRDAGGVKSVEEWRDRVLRPYMGAFGMQPAQPAAAVGNGVAAKAPAAGGAAKVPAPPGAARQDPEVNPAGGAAPALLPPPPDLPVAGAGPAGGAAGEQKPAIQVPAAAPAASPAVATAGSGDVLAGYLGWLNYLARTQRDPAQYALAGPGVNVPFGGMRDLQGVQGQAIDAFGDFLDRQQSRNAGLFAGSLMGYPNQIQRQMALGAQTLAGNQQASVDLKRAQLQAAAAADVGRSNAFGQAFSGLGQAFAELARRQTLNPILGLLAGLLGGGAFGGGADGGMFNRALPIGVNLGFPHYTPATVSHGSGVGRIV